MEEKRTIPENRILCCLTIALTIILNFVLSYFKGQNLILIIRNCFLVLLFEIIYFYSYFKYKDLDRITDNFSQNDRNFFVINIITLAFCAILSFFNPSIWPVIPICIIISLFSCDVIGIMGYTFFLVFLLTVTNINMWFFSIYLICGFAGCVLFLNWHKDASAVSAVLVMSLLLGSLESFTVWLFSDMDNLIFVIIPCLLNIFLNITILVIFLKFYNMKILFGEEDLYMDINDQSYSLLEKFKEDSVDDYYRCIHTAHFADIIAKKINGDCLSVRTASYYYRFGIVYSKIGRTGNDAGEYMLLMMNAHKFPKKSQDLIEELLSRKLKSKESAIVYISDYFVKSIMFLIKEKAGVMPDWDKCVDYVFDKSLDENIFEQCAITVGELKTCMDLLKRDKMYYELLRRE